MNDHPANQDSLHVLNSKIFAYAESQDRILDDEIEIITNGNLASGVFRSGRTINDVVRKCSVLIENRANLTISTIGELPFVWTVELEKELKGRVQQYFPEDLAGFQVKVRNLVRKAASTKHEDVALEDIRKSQRNTLKNLLADVDQYLVTLKHQHQGSAAGSIDAMPNEKSGVRGGAKQFGFESLLHPVILEKAYPLFRDGHLRESVLNSVVATFDLIRERTGLKEDGDKLIGQAFSLSEPYLILSELSTESGQNDQKGFMQIFKGAFQGIRNPKAHSLAHDLTPLNAAQYLVFASLLARRIEEAAITRSDT